MVYRSRHVAIKEHKKAPFIDALSRHGTIIKAARAVRISRWAVDDWNRNDKNFRSEFYKAKERYARLRTASNRGLYTPLTSAIRPLVPKQHWPRVLVAIVNILLEARSFLGHPSMPYSRPAGFLLSGEPCVPTTQKVDSRYPAVHL